MCKINFGFEDQRTCGCHGSYFTCGTRQFKSRDTEGFRTSLLSACCMSPKHCPPRPLLPDHVSSRLVKKGSSSSLSPSKKRKGKEKTRQRRGGRVMSGIRAAVRVGENKTATRSKCLHCYNFATKYTTNIKPVKTGN